MPQRKGAATSPQQAANLSNEHRMVYSTRNGGRRKSADAKTSSVKKGRGNDVERTRLARGSLGFITSDDSGEIGENGEANPDDDCDDDDDDDDESDDANEIAPSGKGRKKRGHQTGLSVSFSNTKIQGGVTTRKRAWSNRAHEEDELERPTKTSKPGTTNDDNDNGSTSDSDEGYEAVDLISESDDDDLVEQHEELLIIQSEEESNFPNIRDLPSSPVLEDWVGHGRPSFPGIEDPFFSEHIGRNDWYEANASTPFGPSALEDVSAALTPPVTRRVRFADDVLGTISSGEETVRGPHNFLDFGLSLPRSGTPFIPDFSSDSDSDEYFWDVGNTTNAGVQLEQPHHLDEGNSSGCETDAGETTDEEIMTPATVNHPQAVLRLDSGTANSRPKSTSSTPVRQTATTPSSNTRRQGPSIGSWVADPTKPIALVDGTGKNIVFFPASNPKKTQARPTTPGNASASPIRPGSSMSAAPSNNDSENERSDNIAQGMLYDSPANLMVSGLNGTAVVRRRSESNTVSGPPKLFYQWRSVDTNGTLIGEDDDDDDDEYDDDEIEARLNIDDFIDFGDDSESDADVGRASPGAMFSKRNHTTSYRKHILLQSHGNHVTQAQINSVINHNNVAQAQPITQILKRRESYTTPRLPSISGPAKRRIETVT